MKQKLWQSTKEPPEYLYRLDTYNESQGYYDWGGDFVSTGHTVKLSLHRYRVIRDTPKGKWISCSPPIWVSNTAVKRYAHPTVEEAKTAFIFRKNRYIEILTARLSDAERGLKLLETWQPQPHELPENLVVDLT